MARILLVEDEEAVCRTIATFLTKHGHDVLAFSDGEPALEALQGEDVDVILTDLLMPFPGQEVVRLARLRGFEDELSSCPELSNWTQPIVKCSARTRP